jgi:predicted HTH domain antitoxin
MSLVIPDDILQAAGISAAELTLEIAVLLYQRGKLSLGQASKLTGITQFQFQHVLSSRQIPLNYDIAEFESDLQTLRA